MKNTTGGHEGGKVDHGVRRVGGVQGPCELRPGPPYEPEDEHCLSDAAPIDVVVEQAYHLRHRKDEHEVEEQLNEGRALVVGRNDGRVRHWRVWTDENL